MTLSVRDHMALRIAATPGHPDARTTAARFELGMSAPIFARHVNVLLDDPEALAAMPREVNRLRRIRDRRRRARAA